jgi:hypothetical protein
VTDFHRPHRSAAARPAATLLIALSMAASACTGGGDTPATSQDIKGTCNAQGDHNVVCATVQRPPVRTPAQWAAEAERLCRAMEPKLDQDSKAVDSIDSDKLKAQDEREIRRFARIIADFQDHYSTLASQLQNVKPPTYSAASVRRFLDLYNRRGEDLNKTAAAVEDGGFFAPLEAYFHISNFNRKSKEIEATAEQLNVPSCT